MKLIVFLLSIFLSFSFSYSLKISEVYFDGSDEFIEIYNEKSNLFSGEIILSGAKSSNINQKISIAGKSYIILGTGLVKYISGNVNYIDKVSINLTDTKAINIKLLSETGNILDSFFVNEDLVKQYNDKKTSFEKIFSGDTETIQAVKTPKNNKTPYIINPGYVQVYTGINIQTGNTVSNVSCWINMSKNSNDFLFSFSGNTKFQTISWYVDNNFIKTGQILSKSMSNGNYTIKGVGIDDNKNTCISYYALFIDKQNIVQSIFTGKLEITEIHPKIDNFPEYIELQAIGNVSGSYVLDGFGRGTSKLILQTTLYSGNYIILAKSYSGFLYTGDILIFDKLNLLDNGEQLSITQDGKVIDKVEYKNGKNLYFTKTENNIRKFETENVASPGFPLYIKDYFKTQNTENINCSIVLQSYEIRENDIKINFDTDIEDKKYCKNTYRQIWTYSGGQTTGTCNPTNFYLSKEKQDISFEVQDLSGNKICEDDYHIFYEKEKNEQENLNCYIKIQTKTSPFLSSSSINFISVVNEKEIQNSNTNYTCSYSLSGQILSSKCNPDSLKLSGGLHKIDLLVKSKSGLSCQTSYYLNLPNENIKTITHSKSIEPINCISMNSSKLNQLVSMINNKYKSEYTLKKVFNPIKYLYEDTTPILDKCLKQNSDNLKILVSKIRQKYKSEYTLKKIFGQDRQKVEKVGLAKIYQINKQKNIIITGENFSGLSIQIGKRKYKLDSNIFTGFKKDIGCLSLFKNDILLDSKCILNNRIYDTNNILFIKNYVIYSNNGILNIEENKPLKDIKKRIKKAFKKIKKIFDKLKKQKLKYKKYYVKESKKAMYYDWKYYLLKQKYKKLKDDYSSYKSKNFEKRKNKNRQIRQLKKQISFLRKFIVSIKSDIDKNIYKKYLENYRKVGK